MSNNYQADARDLAERLAQLGLVEAPSNVQRAIERSSTGTEVAMKLRHWLWSVAEMPDLPTSIRNVALDQISYLDELLR